MDRFAPVTKEEIAEAQKNSDPTWKRRKKSLSKRAKLALPNLVHAYGGRCYWCKRRIVVYRLLADVVKVSHGKGVVTYRVGNAVYTTRMASADHVVPIAENGDSSTGNLVPACFPCNRLRQKRQSQPLRKGYCRECRIPLTGKMRHKRRCHDCSDRKIAAWLRKYGWDFWPDPPRPGDW